MRAIKIKLERIFKKATPEQVDVGVNWYLQAHDHALRLAREFKLPLFKVTGVMSALSPNNKWERNLADTRAFLAAPSLTTKVCTFLGQRKKALEILGATSSSEVRTILSGRKTISFFDNISNPNLARAVTVDLWMYRMAELDQTHKNYEIISEAVLNLSQKYNVLPHQFQAIVWSVVRPNKGA